MLTTICPHAERLAAFQAGMLKEEELSQIADHLETCSWCQTVMENDRTPSDALVRELRQAESDESFADESGCHRAIARVEALANGEATHTRDDTAQNAPLARTSLTMLGKYQLLEQIGQGGMGTVYKAVHTLLKRTVAVKVLPANRLLDAQAVNRFRREIEAAGRLDHPHIVRASDADEAEGQHFLVMEWLAGQDLSRFGRERGPLPVEQACDFIRQAALGLECAHEHGMVHRDVKPSNLLLTVAACGKPLVKVLDLGLALLNDHVAAEDPLTGVGQVMGTYDYLAPEQATESHAVDARADIYSLGCTFYFLLAGAPPFAGRSEAKKLLAHQLHEPTSITNFRSDVPSEVIAVLAKMMAKKPSQRFDSMREVAEALEKFASNPAPSEGDTKKMGARRRPLRFKAWWLLGLLALGTTAWGVIRFATPQGDIVIDTDDDNFAFRISKGKVILTDSGAKRSYNLNIVRQDKAKGEYELEVTDADSGEIFKTKTFQVKRGEQFALKAWFVPKRSPEVPRPPIDDSQPKPPAIGEIRRYVGHQDGIRCLTFSPDGNSFLAGSSGELWLWDVGSTTERVRFPNTQGNIQSAVFTQDGERVIGPAQVGSVVMWEAKRGDKVRELARFKIPGWVECVMASPDRPHVIYSNRNGCRIYDLEKKEELPMRFLGERAGLSKNGRRLLTGDVKTLYLWDVDTGKELSNAELPGGIFRVALAPDGRHALASVDKIVYQWNMDEKKQGKRLDGPSSVLGLAIAPDGKRALTGGHDKKMRLWDLETGGELACFDGHTAPVTSVAFAPNGRQALSGSDDKTVRLWQLPTRVDSIRIEPKKSSAPNENVPVLLKIVTKLGVDVQVEVAETRLFDGSSGSYLRESYSSATREFLKEPEPRDGGPGRIALDLGSGVYFVIPLRQIERIETQEKQHVVTLADGSQQKGKLLTTVVGKDKRIWNLADVKLATVVATALVKPAPTLQPRTLLKVPGPVEMDCRLASFHVQSGGFTFGRRIKLTVDGEALTPDLTDFDKIVVSGAGGAWRVRLTAPAGVETTGTWEIRHPSSGFSRWSLIGATRNGWHVIIVYSNLATTGFSLEKERALQLLATSGPNTDGITQLTVSRDGSKMLAFSSDHVLSYWELDAAQATFKQRWKNKLTEFVHGIALHPSGASAWFALRGGSNLSQVDILTGDVSERRKGRHDGAERLVFSPDGRRYLAADFYGGITLRDAQDGEVLRSMPGHAEGNYVRPAPHVCFSADGERILSSGADHTVRLWNSADGVELKKLVFPAAKKRFIALSPAGTQALVSQDNDVQVWDLVTGKMSSEWRGHKDHVTALVYGPDGNWAVSASKDTSLRVWDVNSGGERAKLEGHFDDVTCVATAAQGRFIISGSRDKTLRAWKWTE